jgi:hypothetical protein
MRTGPQAGLCGPGAGQPLSGSIRDGLEPLPQRRSVTNPLARLSGFPLGRAGVPDRWRLSIGRGVAGNWGARRATGVRCPGPQGPGTRRRSAAGRYPVVGGHGLAHHGLGREADHQGKQVEHRRLLCWRLDGLCCKAQELSKPGAVLQPSFVCNAAWLPCRIAITSPGGACAIRRCDQHGQHRARNAPRDNLIGQRKVQQGVFAPHDERRGGHTPSFVHDTAEGGRRDGRQLSHLGPD